MDFFTDETYSLLYTSIPKYEELNTAEKNLYHNDKELYNKSARKGSQTLYFAKSGTDFETWVPLLEKVWPSHSLVLSFVVLLRYSRLMQNYTATMRH
jgi:hypothetical protein